MKLKTGENIRNYRKRNGLTQQEFADRLGVSYQSVSRWENSITYPDLEFIPSIAELLAVTVDELFGLTQTEMEKRAAETFDELRRECVKRDLDTERIVTLLKDIRLNYLCSNSAWRPWVEGNQRAFSDPKILPEVRLLAEAYLKRYPLSVEVIEAMAEVEDEEHINNFIDNYSTPFDCSKRKLLFNRYLTRGDSERIEPERTYQLFAAFDKLLDRKYLLKLHASKEDEIYAMRFTEKLSSVIRSDASDDSPDIWAEYRIELGIRSAAESVLEGKSGEAISKLSSVVKLLEETMKITGEITLSASCRLLEGLSWKSHECWGTLDNCPDSPIDRYIFIYTCMSGMTTCYCIFPRRYLSMLKGDRFYSLSGNPEFEKLCERVSGLIVTKRKDD